MVKCDPREGKYSKCLLRGSLHLYAALTIYFSGMCVAVPWRRRPQGHPSRRCEHQDEANNPVRRLVPDWFQGLLFSEAQFISILILLYILQLGICYEPSACVPGGDLAKTTRSLCMLSKFVHLRLYLAHDLIGDL